LKLTSIFQKMEHKNNKSSTYNWIRKAFTFCLFSFRFRSPLNIGYCIFVVACLQQVFTKKGIIEFFFFHEVDFTNISHAAFSYESFHTKLLCAYILGLNFICRKNIGANALIKCWRNWPQKERTHKQAQWPWPNWKYRKMTF
jgi:hypothetical protein